MANFQSTNNKKGITAVLLYDMTLEDMSPAIEKATYTGCQLMTGYI